MKFNNSDQFVVNRDGQPYRVSFDDVASDVAEKKVKDGKLTIKDGDNVLGEFTANQEGNTDVVIYNSDLTERVSDLEEEVHGLSSDVSSLPDPVTYTIQTDKISRSLNPAIELVDSEGYFSNVKFEKTGRSVAINSTPSSIIIDTTDLDSEIDTVHETQSDIMATNANQTEQLDAHASLINALETQIQLLAQSQAAGKWKYFRNAPGGSVRPPTSQTFYGSHKSSNNNVLLNWTDLNNLFISKTDLNDTKFTFTNFVEGDKIEILATDGTSAAYGTVTNVPNQESYGNLVVAVERSTNGPIDDKEYLINIYRPGAAAGEVDLDVLDNRYLQLTGGNLTGNLNTNSLIKSTRDTGYAFQVKPNDVTANAYIHSNGNAQFKNLFITNESINTDNIIGRPLEITGRLSDGHTISSNFFYMYNNNDGTASALNYNGKMDGDANLVNKGYVDAQKGKIRTGTSTNPTLNSGEMFWNTQKKVLYIGD